LADVDFSPRTTGSVRIAVEGRRRRPFESQLKADGVGLSSQRAHLSNCAGKVAGMTSLDRDNKTLLDELEAGELLAALRMSMEPTAPSVSARVKLHSLQRGRGLGV